MYNALYAWLGLPWRYDLMDCATDEEARGFLQARDCLSVNVTTPYKPHAFEAATARAASAKLAQEMCIRDRASAFPTTTSRASARRTTSGVLAQPALYLIHI